MSEEESKQALDQAVAEAKAAAKEKEKRDKLRVMDPNDRFYMAGIMPFEPDAFAEYVPVAFRVLPKEKQAVFLLRDYDRASLSEYHRAISMRQDPYQEVLAALKASGCIGWRNLVARDGKEIEVGDKSALERLSSSLVYELHWLCYAYSTGILPEEAEGLE